MQQTKLLNFTATSKNNFLCKMDKKNPQQNSKRSPRVLAHYEGFYDPSQQLSAPGR